MPLRSGFILNKSSALVLTFLLVVGGERRPTLGPAASMMKEMFSICGPQTREDPNRMVHLLRSSHAWRHFKTESLS